LTDFKSSIPKLGGLRCVPVGTPWAPWAGLSSVAGHSQSNGNSRSYRNALGGATAVYGLLSSDASFRLTDYDRYE